MLLETVSNSLVGRAAAALVDVDRAEPGVAHLLRLPGNRPDRPALARQRDVAVVGHGRADQSVGGATKEAVRQHVAFAQLDLGGGVALDRVRVDVDPALAGDVEAAVAIEDVVGAGDPTLARGRRGPLPVVGDVEIDQLAALSVNLEQVWPSVLSTIDPQATRPPSS